MSTFTTPKGNKVEINWRDHASEGPEDIDYLLDQVDSFSDSIKAYHNVLDTVSVVYHITKNKPAVKTKAETPKQPKKKGMVEKAVDLVTGKKSAKKGK